MIIKSRLMHTPFSAAAGPIVVYEGWSVTSLCGGACSRGSTGFLSLMERTKMKTRVRTRREWTLDKLVKFVVAKGSSEMKTEVLREMASRFGLTN